MMQLPNSHSLICFILWNLLVAILSFSNGVQASHRVYPEFQSLAAVTVRQLHRTAFHFQPAKHWINDPNGPLFYKGLYHLFYQYNPKGSVWGNIIWAHSISNDLLNWEEIEPAIFPSKPFDINGTWSGSATIFPGEKVYLYYTGIDSAQHQLQNYAIPEDPSDPKLTKWIKPDEGNPFIVADKEINVSAFRDPTTAWHSHGYWYTTVGSRKDRVGVAYLFKSQDLKTWTKTPAPLHQAPDTGMWECPDFYPVLVGPDKVGLEASARGEHIKHVLKVSLDETRYEYYTVGTYLADQEKYVPDKGQVDGWGGLRTDYGNFYASKSFFDPVKNRRITWGWTNESDSKMEDVRKGWAGIMALPRTVLLDPNGKQIVQWPIQEIETLRGKQINLEKTPLVPGKPFKIDGITAAQVDIEIVFSIPSLDKAEPFDPTWKDAQDICYKKKSKVPGAIGPFGLLAFTSDKFEEYTPIFFRIFKGQNNKPVVVMCQDAGPSTLTERVYKPMFGGFVDVDLADKTLSLRTLIDHSVVESFAEGGKTCITSRVYPTLAVFDNARLFAFNNGSEPVSIEKGCAWSMERPKKMND